MKYSIITVFAILLFIGCSKKETDKNLHITGNIQGLKKGTLYIQKIVDSSLVVIDTIEINGDSKFESFLDIKSPEMYYLFLDRGVTNSIDNNLPFFAEAGNINIDTSLEFFYTNSKITGSKNQNKFEEYKKVISRYNNQNLILTELKFKAYKEKKAKTLDSINELQDAIVKRRYLYTTNFAVTNGDLEVAPYLALTEIYDINLKYLDTIQKSMTPEVEKSMYGMKLKKYFELRNKSENK